MLKILTSNVSIESAIKLREEICNQLGIPTDKILVSKHFNHCRGHNVILRYGNGYGKLDMEPAWGSSTLIDHCLHKDKFAKKFGSAVRTPIFVTDKFPHLFPVLIRETLEGSASQGISLVRTPEEFLAKWRDGFVWTLYKEHSMEIRVLVVITAAGEIKTKIYKKVPRDFPDHPEEFICGINGEDNTKWVPRDIGNFTKVAKILEAMKDGLVEIGVGFIALDMIYVDEERDWMVLEGNSGPWLSPSACEFLAKEFIDFIGKAGIYKGLDETSNGKEKSDEVSE